MPVFSTSTGLPTVAEARAHANIPTASSDAELQGFLNAAVATITYYVGPIEPKAYSEVRDAGSPVLFLDHGPVLSVDSVTEYLGLTAYPLTSQPPGSTVSNYGYSLDDPDEGKLVRRSNAGLPMAFWGGRMSVVIDYTCGRDSLPDDMRLAILELVRDMWSGTQSGGAGAARYGQDVQEPVASSGRPVLPPYVFGLIEPYIRTSGVVLA